MPKIADISDRELSAGTDEYDGLAQCVVSILQTQVDHERAAPVSTES